MEQLIRPGISTLELDTLGEEMIRKLGCVPNFKNYNGITNHYSFSFNDYEIINAW